MQQFAKLCNRKVELVRFQYAPPIIIALLMLFATTCNAQELYFIGHGFSKHVVDNNYNDKTYGAALRLEKDNFAIQAGTYHNSIHNQSLYAGIDWSPIHYSINGFLNFDAGLYAGGATGYKYTVIPMAGIQASFKYKDVFVRVRAMPDLFFKSKGVAAIEIGFILKRF